MKFLRQELPQFLGIGNRDVRISCGDNSYSVHSLMLAASSAFLQDIIQDVVEEGSEETVTIILPEFDSKEVDYLISLLYCTDSKHFNAPAAQPGALFEQLEVGWFHTDQSLPVVVPPKLSSNTPLQDAALKIEVDDYLDGIVNGSSECGTTFDGENMAEDEEKENIDDVNLNNTIQLSDSTREKPICEICCKVLTICSHRSAYQCDQCNVCNQCAQSTAVTNFDEEKYDITEKLIGDNLPQSKYSDQNTSLDDTERLHKCAFCMKEFVKKSTLRGHLRTHTRPFKCDQCDKAFAKKRTLEDHLATHTGLVRYKCDLCGERFRHHQNLTRHKRKHKGQLYPCNKCTQQFTRKDYMKLHMTKSHPETGVTVISKTRTASRIVSVCNVCHKSFPSRKTMTLHMKKEHTSDLPFLCQFCDKGFFTKFNLELHERIHREDKRFKCELCDKGFYAKCMLVGHIGKVHPGEVLIKCFHCSERFCNVDDRTKHLHEIHPDSPIPDVDLYDGKISYVRSLVCEFCSKSFKYQTQLENHIRMHTGEKPYKCTQCDKMFSQSGHLQRHMRFHTGERPFACDLCDKSFAEKGNLLVHRKLHSGKRTFACNVCSKVFGTERTLKDHLKRHQEEESLGDSIRYIAPPS